MRRILYLKASPRAERSRSVAVTEAFLGAYRAAHPGDKIESLDIFKKRLPPFDGPALDAKYQILHGSAPTPAQVAAWKTVERLIAQFKSADAYVLAVPMWNFGIPYRLKQYFDIIVQPTYTFSYSPGAGYTGLVRGKRAFVAYARGGDYGDSPALDFQRRYVECILGFMGITDVRSVVLEGTLASGPEVAQPRLDEALAEARRLAAEF